MPAPKRTLAAVAVLAFVLAVPAALGHGGALHSRKHRLDSRISGLRAEIAEAKDTEGVLTSEITAATDNIETLEGKISVLADRLAQLEADLDRHRDHLARLEKRYREQTRILERLTREHALAQQQLERRLVELYETDQAELVGILLQAESLTDLIEQVDYVNEIGRQDRRIVAELRRLKIAMREAREKTAEIKAEVARETAVLARKVDEEREARAHLIAQQSALAAARSDKRELLAGVREDRHEAEEDLDAMQAASAALAARIQAAQAAAAAAAAAQQESSSDDDGDDEPSSGSSNGSSSGSTGSGSSGTASGGADTTSSASGFIWPVSGPVTSGFGYRWGRLHAGIDISAPTGTAVRAAASGEVIHAGWMGGYGQVVVIDHGGGLTTAYAHHSSIWASGSVSQGQGIGADGCTGSCTGSHLHFEVRVNGSPVDPFTYL